MPVHSATAIPRLNRTQFGEASFRVMEHVFAIHRDFGGFFDERIYKQELGRRLPGVQLEVPVDVTHHTFTKRYFLDVLSDEGALFEFKTVGEIAPRHRAQLLNYLLLLDLAHGKLVNLRPGEVKHEFVNAAVTTAERRRLTIQRSDFDLRSPGAAALEAILVSLVEDLGTGLERNLYEEAVTHFLGGETKVEREINVVSGDGTPLGTQRLRLCAPQAALKLTTFAEPPRTFAHQCGRLLRYLPLEAVQWVNIANHVVTLTTVRRTTEDFCEEKHAEQQQSGAAIVRLSQHIFLP